MWKDIQHYQSLEMQSKCKVKPQWDITTYLLACLQLKGLITVCIEKDVGKLELSCTAGEMWNGATILENSLEVSHKVKYITTIFSSHFLPR